MPAYLGSAMTRRIAVIQTFVYPNAYNDHLVWGSILVLVLTRGPGVFSLDCLIARTAARTTGDTNSLHHYASANK